MINSTFLLCGFVKAKLSSQMKEYCKKKKKHLDKDNHRKRKGCSLKDDNPNLQTPIQVKFCKKSVCLEKCVDIIASNLKVALTNTLLWYEFK
jgi:hypothetical protein